MRKWGLGTSVSGEAFRHRAHRAENIFNLAKVQSVRVLGIELRVVRAGGKYWMSPVTNPFR